MIAYLSILKITCKAAIRSHTFRVLLALLLFTVIALPLSILGDGTARSFIQISLNYNLSAIAFILSLSTIWLSCFIMTSDIDNFQLHMVVSKPVSRITVWLAKWSGVLLINTILLCIASATVYFMILWHYNNTDYDKGEKEQIKNQVLVGRRVFHQRRKNLSADVNKLYKQKLKELAKENKQLNNYQKTILQNNIKEYVKGAEGEVRNGLLKTWIYEDLYSLKNKKDLPLYIRFRVYPDKFEIKKQYQTYGIWAVKVDQAKLNKDKAKKNADKDRKIFFAMKTEEPELIPCASFQEISFFTSNIIDDKGKIIIGFINADPAGGNLHFQLADGPIILAKITGFTNNYIRAVFLLFLQLALLAAISCAFGGLFSMPVSISLIISYLIMGFCSNYLITFYNSIDSISMAKAKDFYDIIGNNLSRFLMFFIVSINDFNASAQLAAGKLIEFSYITEILIFEVIIKGLTVMLIGIYFYSKRELGVVIKKS